MDAQPLNLLPGRGLPAGTPEGSVVDVRTGALRRPVECLCTSVRIIPETAVCRNLLG
jgi:hypothetical protein